jgi:predicted ATPase
VGDVLRDAGLLLVLDNCEHVLAASAALVAALLRESPGLRILATSREPIGIPGEINWPIQPLTTPRSSVATSILEIESSPAVRLFVDRASAVAPRLRVAENNARAIAQICSRLHGIPLALELAAACLDALSPDQIAARLDHRFQLLT